MNTETEVKFVQLDHDVIREKLTKIGAIQTNAMRLMRRVIIETPELKSKNAYIRIRDEGSKTTLTYKQFDELSVDGAKEIELEVSDFQKAHELFDAVGLQYKSYQESKRESWEIDGVEVVLDLWPWLDPYIEIEGEDVESLKRIAEKLDLSWDNAVFGDVMAAYRVQYPHLSPDDTVGNLQIVKFDDPMPAFLKSK